MKKVVVTVENNGVKFWLRGTTWAFHRDRANEFDSQAEAFAAIQKASPFMVKQIRNNLKMEDA